MSKQKRFVELFQPENYKLYFDINRNTKLITGRTIISGVASDVEIYLHQKNLNIFNVKQDGEDVKFELQPNDETVKIYLLETGKITLSLSYEADLTDTMMGIYPSYYQVDGVKKQLIGTQFESTAARQAFPGIDEPAAKATFELAIKFDEHPGEIILANMPETKVEDGVHHFEKTVKMSTYLVAFVFGELQSKIVESKSGVKVGVFATKAHQPKELDFAVDIAKRSIEFFEDYYQTPYPLAHAWNVALPDFSAGAMENWGLLTYREAYLVLDQENTAFDMKQTVATVISHELAHQWFGDLVTMKWWDDLWLNESFANMMEYVAIDAIEPDWHVWELFQTSDIPSALLRDSTDGVQSVHVPVEDPAEIDSIFDGAIVYAKGARMLVMVRAMIGDDAMRAGLKSYFKKYQYSNATGADLWQEFSNASGIDVGEIMNSWLEQPGYPVINASLDNDVLRLTQNQFFIGKSTKMSRLWQIPLKGNFKEVPAIMKEQTLELPNYQEMRVEAKAPFQLNVGNESHFIVQYDEQLQNDLLENILELDPIDQRQFLQNQWLLAQARQISFASLVDLLPLFKNSESYIVNDILHTIVNDLKKFVEIGSKEEKNLKQFVDDLSHEQLNRLGILPTEAESNDDALTRPYILNASLYADSSTTIEAVHQVYLEYEDKLVKLPASIRLFVLANEIRNFGTDKLFDKFIKEYQLTTDGSFKEDLSHAITKAKSAELNAKTINLFMDSSVIKPQDLRDWFMGVLANDEGQELAWNWVRDNWTWLEDTVGGDMEFTTYITVIARIFKTTNRLAEFKEFFEPKINQPGLTREIKMDINVIAGRIDLIEAEKEDIASAIIQNLEK